MKSKKLTAILLTSALLFSLAACTNAQTNNGSTSQTQQSSDISDTVTGGVSSKKEQSEIVSDISSEDNSEEKTTGKKLIIYFSASNRKDTDTDTVSSATPMSENVSATQHIAQLIQKETGGDIVKIVPSVDYPTEYNDVADYAKNERDNNERPKFEDLGVNIEDYDTIYIGYPIWWYQLPMIMDTFFDTYDFSGKTIIPFNTHEGSGNGGTYSRIRELEPDASVPEGLAVRGGEAFDDVTKQAVKDWISGLE